MTRSRTTWYVVWSDGSSTTIDKARGFRHAALLAARTFEPQRHDVAEVRKFRVVGTAITLVRRWRWS